jgi:hypothetical protein
MGRRRKKAEKLGCKNNAMAKITLVITVVSVCIRHCKT